MTSRRAPGRRRSLGYAAQSSATNSDAYKEASELRGVSELLVAGSFIQRKAAFIAANGTLKSDPLLLDMNPGRQRQQMGSVIS